MYFILLHRIRPSIDPILRANQAGFRPGRSCIQQIHTLRRIIESAIQHDMQLNITFVDFKKAFDSINRRMLFAILRHYGIPEKIVNGIKVLYDDSNGQVLVEGELSEPFNIITGILQGDILAPFLFIIVMDYILKKASIGFGFKTHNRKSSRKNKFKHLVMKQSKLDWK